MNFFHALLLATVFCYFLTTSMGVFDYSKDQPHPTNKLFIVFFHLTAFLITACVIAPFFTDKKTQVIGFQVVAVLTWINLYFWYKLRVRPLAVAGVGMGFIILMTQLFFSPHGISKSPFMLTLHIFTAVSAQGFAAFATVIAILQWVQVRFIKSQKNSALPLSISEMNGTWRWAQRFIYIGFILMSFSLLLGFWLRMDSEEALSLSPKLLWASFVWSWFLAIILGMIVFKLRIQKIRALILIGFLLLVSTYFGANI